MLSALVIGAGTIGSRHLQGLAKSPRLSEIFVVEPREEARRTAETLWHEVPASAARTLRFVDWASLPALAPPRFALVATTAPGRLAIVERLLAIGVRHMLLEKIPFQSVADYRRAVELIAAVGAAAHVNLPMRMIPLFQALRRRLAGRPLVMHVENGDRGLGCNGLHYFDLFAFIADAEPNILDMRVDKPVRSDRRGGIDFSGDVTLSAESGARCTVRFVPGTTGLPVISVSFDDLHLVADFNGDAVRSSDPALLDEAFFMPMASQLAHRQMDGILDGDTVLPSLADGLDLNRRMLDAFNRQLIGHASDDTICPIT